MLPGGQPDNDNATRGKLWRAAIKRALDRRSMCRSDGVAALDAIADSLLEIAEAGSIKAIKELGDRLDGKSVQAQELSGPDGAELKGITVVFKSDS